MSYGGGKTEQVPLEQRICALHTGNGKQQQVNHNEDLVIDVKLAINVEEDMKKQISQNSNKFKGKSDESVTGLVSLDIVCQ